MSEHSQYTKKKKHNKRGKRGKMGFNGPTGPVGPQGPQGPAGESSLLLAYIKYPDSTILLNERGGVGIPANLQSLQLNQNDKIILTSQFQYKYNVDPDNLPFQYGKIVSTFYIQELNQNTAINVVNNGDLDINNESSALITKSNYILNSESVHMTYVFNVPINGTYNIISTIMAKFNSDYPNNTLNIIQSYLSVIKILGDNSIYNINNV